jgi:hypothetical protein
MQNAGKQAKELGGGILGTEAGDTYTGVSYGDDLVCPNCQSRHPIYETQMVYEVVRNIIKLLLEQTPAPPAMMLGVLRGENGSWFAACSPADGQPGQVALQNAVRNGRVKLPSPMTLVGNLPAAGSTSRGQKPVTAQDVRNCTVNGQPIAGRCAAPKLIHVAIQQNIQRPWRMSEVWFDPALQNNTYRHLDTAESCLTCRNLLPLLLCNQGPDVNLITFTGLIRAQWGGF